MRAAVFNDAGERNEDRGKRPRRSLGEEVALAMARRVRYPRQRIYICLQKSVLSYQADQLLWGLHSGAARYFRALRHPQKARAAPQSLRHTSKVIRSSRKPIIMDAPQHPPLRGLTTHSAPSDYSLLPPMATSRDAPNPLRPYYIPPSIGLPPDLPQNQTATPSYSAPTYSPSSHKPSFGSQARDILSDLDYDSYFADSSPSVAGHARRLLDQALWNYTSVLLAQPFEVAKTILQIHHATGQAPPGLMLNGEEIRSRPNSFASGKYEDVCPHCLFACRRNCGC